MRIVVAAVVLLDLGVRLSDLEVFYANTGAVPLSLVFRHTWNNYYLSLHAMSGLWQFQLILFLAAICCASMLMLGYRTRIFTFLTWLLMLSLHNRNTLVLQGGDDLLRMVLFWAIFLPWGDAYSCDSLLQSVAREKVQLNVATVAYVLQICYIYTGSALLKGREWNADFTAMYYVYGLDQIAYPVTKFLFYHPSLLKAMTMVAWYFELFIPVLFFVPVRHQWFRTSAVMLICGFHVFNCATLLIGMFPLIGIATVLGMLPSAAMDSIERRTARLRPLIVNSFLSHAESIRRFIPAPSLATITRGSVERVRTAGLVFLIAFVFDWNFSNFSFAGSRISDNLRVIGYALRLDQNWGMFAPGVFKDDGWLVIEGTTRDGKKVNLFNAEGTLSYRKPEAVTALFRNDRWRKFTENLILGKNTFMRGYFLNYAKRIWNENHPDEPVQRVELVYMSEFTLPDYRCEPPKRESLWIIGESDKH
jgi:hypothetical protein